MLFLEFKKKKQLIGGILFFQSKCIFYPRIFSVNLNLWIVVKQSEDNMKNCT